MKTTLHAVNHPQSADLGALVTESLPPQTSSEAVTFTCSDTNLTVLASNVDPYAVRSVIARYMLRYLPFLIHSHSMSCKPLSLFDLLRVYRCQPIFDLHIQYIRVFPLFRIAPMAMSRGPCCRLPLMLSSPPSTTEGRRVSPVKGLAHSMKHGRLVSLVQPHRPAVHPHRPASMGLVPHGTRVPESKLDSTSTCTCVFQWNVSGAVGAI